jgi:hypothetical protein
MPDETDAGKPRHPKLVAQVREMGDFRCEIEARLV